MLAFLCECALPVRRWSCAAFGKLRVGLRGGEESAGRSHCTTPPTCVSIDEGCRRALAHWVHLARATCSGPSARRRYRRAIPSPLLERPGGIQPCGRSRSLRYEVPGVLFFTHFLFNIFFSFFFFSPFTSSYQTFKGK